ncbi:calreticulin isoform X1 [Hydra vulgaris]|uniref:Calreticulin n=1 Tax=Hydra vulgaris TaxID=6087 RepID=T2MFY9_HYDVU|nr:calreticulin isoform X1 [Hydra vulgaris]
MMSVTIFVLAFIAFAQCTVYFKDTFDDETWEKRWIHSKSKGGDAGKFKLSSGKFYGDKARDQGIQTSQDAKFYQVSAKVPNPFSNEGKTLVLQYQVKHEQNIDCGGGYIKLFPSTITPETMNGDSPYHIMFGPDICGPGTKKVHVIFTYKGKNLLTKKDIRCKDDEMTHLYTLIVKPDNTYEVRIDGSKVESGTLEGDWDFLPPKRIKDPSLSKPADWVDEAKIDDPEDKKPEGYDKPELIPDKDATKPEDWDAEEDGEWEPPMINNPEYKGEWKPRKIDNPAYKGEWVHPEIDNPEYKSDDNLYKYDDIGYIGFEIWQVKSGTIFDNIIVTDDIAEAEKFAKETFEKTKVEEKQMKDKIEEEERKKREEEEARTKKEEEEKKKDEKEEEEEDDEDTKEDTKEEEKPAVEDSTDDTVKDEL